MAKSCSRCGVTLLVDTEVDRNYGGGAFIGAGAADRALDRAGQRQRDLDAVGVTCAACGRHFCSKCMLSFGRRHPTSGGLACLQCGGQMAHFSG